MGWINIASSNCEPLTKFMHLKTCRRLITDNRGKEIEQLSCSSWHVNRCYWQVLLAPQITSPPPILYLILHMYGNLIVNTDHIHYWISYVYNPTRWWTVSFIVSARSRRTLSRCFEDWRPACPSFLIFIDPFCLKLEHSPTNQCDLFLLRAWYNTNIPS